MAKRRNNQEGTICKLPSGRWRAQITVNGKRIGHTAETRLACAQWLRSVDLNPTEELPEAEEQQTFGEYLEEWLVSIKTHLKPKTIEQYTHIVRAHIAPALGSTVLTELKPAAIQKLYDTKLAAGSHPRTVQLMHAVIHRSLHQAVKLGLLEKNPDDATLPPKPASTEMQFYDEAQVTQFLIAAKGDRLEILYYLALYTGMRQAELLGLRWADVDWQKMTVRVQRQLRRDFGEGEYYAPTKTKAGRRTVQLGANGIAKLREQLQRQNLERATHKDRWEENDLIFPSSVGTPLNHSNLVKNFKRIVKLAGLPEIRFHDLRHTAASLMLNYGVPPIIVSRRLGHSRVSITLDTYGHLMPEMQGEAADLMDGLITPISIKLHTTAHDDAIPPEK